MTANIETMAYVKRSDRDIPWHKLGTAVPEGAASAEEIIAAAGLEWSVSLAKMFLHPKDGSPIVEVPNARAIVRNTDRRIFGVATDSYTPLQNREAFESVAEWLADGRLQFETAGALGDGSRVWGLARTGEDFLIGGKDAIAPYVLLLNGHDGKTSVVLKPVTTRVVCANTLAMALGEKEHREYRIRHTASVKDRIKDASKALDMVSKQTAALAAKFDILAQLPATDEQLAKVAEIIAPDAPSDATEEQRRKVQQERLKLWEVYQYSQTVDRGTRWGIFNAATEYIDHFQQRRGQNRDSTNADWLERRAVWSLETGAEVREKVFKTLVPA